MSNYVRKKASHDEVIEAVKKLLKEPQYLSSLQQSLRIQTKELFDNILEEYQNGVFSIKPTVRKMPLYGDHFIHKHDFLISLEKDV